MNWQQRLHAKLPLGELSFQHQEEEGNRDSSPNEKGYKNNGEKRKSMSKSAVYWL